MCIVSHCHFWMCLHLRYLRPLRTQCSVGKSSETWGGRPRRGITPRADTMRSRCRRSEEHTSELQSLMRISYAVFCLKKNITNDSHKHLQHMPNNITN